MITIIIEDISLTQKVYEAALRDFLTHKISYYTPFILFWSVLLQIVMLALILYLVYTKVLQPISELTEMITNPSLKKDIEDYKRKIKDRS